MINIPCAQLRSVSNLIEKRNKPTWNISLAIDSLNKLAFNNMCSCYNQQNEWEKAKISCENALKIDPDFQIAKNNLNWTLGELKSQ
jgi:tetratricopeptide (TPR) repeat protein